MKYAELRKIDVTDHIEKKGQFSYLSWTYAVDTLLQNDPTASWRFNANLTLPDGSMMVFCVLTAFGKETHMQLPVLDYKNNAIKNPTAMHLNTAMMRCLAKAIACTGIGLHIYAGEDLPPSEPSPPPEPLNQAQVKALEDGIDGCFTMNELKDKFAVVYDHFKSGRLKKNDFDTLAQFKDERKNTLTCVKRD